jgi:hypothetical protein
MNEKDAFLDLLRCDFSVLDRLALGHLGFVALGFINDG